MQTGTQIELDGQYRALREQVGLVDHSERGKLWVHGPEAADYLQGQLTNDIEALEPGAGCYAALLNRKGHMQGDMRVLCVAEDRLWIDTEQVATPAVARHLDMYRVGRDAALEDVSSEFRIISLIGPGSEDMLGSTPGGEEFANTEIEIAPAAQCRAVRAELGIDLICFESDAAGIRERLVAQGAAQVSPEAAEILRVEAGRPRFGAEMTTKTIPQEAGIEGRAVSFTKGCYIGQETVARLHYKGRPNRHLRGLRLESAVEDEAVVRLAERELGRVGTAVLSPARGPIALAILRREVGPGDRVMVGEAGVEAEVVDLPFE